MSNIMYRISAAVASALIGTLWAIGEPRADTGKVTGIRVVFRSFETAAISSELNARITYLPAREGDRIRKGERIVEFDCTRLRAQADAAEAALKARQAVFTTQQTLFKYKAAGTLSTEQAEAELEKAEADVRALEAQTGSCTVLAPFDGRVVEKNAHIHELAQPNQPLIKIVNETKLELVLMVPSTKLAEFATGSRFTVTVDETGEQHEARVLQTTGLIDPISQSARLLAELAEPSPSILPGMSGTARFLEVAHK